MKNDLISRSALLNDLLNLKPSGFENSFAGRVALDRIVAAPVVDATPTWFSVSDGLPEPYHTYLVVIKMKYSWETEWEYHVDVADLEETGGYIEDRWNTFNDWDEGQEIHVTHWMPLPEPPKEG